MKPREEGFCVPDKTKAYKEKKKKWRVLREKRWRSEAGVLGVCVSKEWVLNLKKTTKKEDLGLQSGDASGWLLGLPP